MLVRSETVETHMTPFGVLDMHFSPQNPLLGVTTSTGSIALYEWCTQPGLIKKEYLIHRHTLQLFDTSTVITSLAWDLHMANRVYLSSTTGEISAVTLSSEEIEAGSADLPSRNKFHAASQRLFYELDTVTRHDLEAWTVVTTPLSWTTQGLFSGGDDASVKFTPFSDARNGTCDTDASDNAASTTPWLNNRIHGAGVVSILPLMNGILLTGSYDDHLRIISTPSIFGLKPQVLHELNLGGGVWRLKPIPLGTRGSGQDISMTDQFEMRVLISGMYAGAFIVDIKRDVEMSWSSRIVARFTEHESMNYACDVVDSLSLDVQTPRTLVSCSFYDKRLCLWKF